MFGFFSHGLGMDISDHHIRLARVTHGGLPHGFYEAVIPHGLVSDERINDPKELQAQVERLVEKAGLAHAKLPTIFLVPESRVFTAAFSLPSHLRPDDRLTAALKMAQQTIPIPLTQVAFDITDGTVVNQERPVTLYAVEKNVCQSLLGLCASDAFLVRAGEANSTALFRLFDRFGTVPDVKMTRTSRVLLIDVGHRWTNISVYNVSGRSLYSRSIALRHLASKEEHGKHKATDVFSDALCVRIGAAAKEAVDAFSDKEHPIEVALIAGVEGMEKGVQEACAKALKGWKTLSIGEAVKIPGASKKDIHTFGAAMGAALRAARPGVYTAANNFLRYSDLV